MKLTSMFARKPTLAEAQEEDELLTVEESIATKRAAIRELENRGGDWHNFSTDGKKSGLDLRKVWNWLRTH